MEAANISIDDHTDAITSDHAWLAHTRITDFVSSLYNRKTSRIELLSFFNEKKFQTSFTPTHRPICQCYRRRSICSCYYATAFIRICTSFCQPCTPFSGFIAYSTPNISEPHIHLNRRSATNQENTNGFEDTRKANYVTTQVSSRLFTSDISQSIAHDLRDCEQRAKQNGLSDNQKTEYFINTLGNTARKFFLRKYEGVTYFMLSEYNSNARQIQVLWTLQPLKFDSFSVERNLSNPALALTLLVTYIERLLPQCPPSFLGDEHKTALLRRAVIEHQWSRVPKRNCDISAL